MYKKRGLCLCQCGGVVINSSDTIIYSDDALYVSCRKCYRVWSYDYAYAKQPESGKIVLNESDQDFYMSQYRKGFTYG
jgi:hypothetical protein